MNLGAYELILLTIKFRILNRGKIMINIWNGKPPDYKANLDKDANKDKPELEAFTINDGDKHSCFLILPGGGYNHLSNHEGANVAKELNKVGISAFVLYYRVAPYHHPSMLWDTKRAIRYIRHNADKYNIDVDKIGIMGFSAGGHLSGLTTIYANEFDYNHIDEVDKNSANVNALCMCYPVVSTINEDIFHLRSTENLTGDNKELRSKLSLEHNIPNNMPPTFVWHTFEDKSVDCRNSLYFAEAMKKSEKSIEFHLFPEGKHGLDMAKGIRGTEQWFLLFINWLKRNGF